MESLGDSTDGHQMNVSPPFSRSTLWKTLNLNQEHELDSWNLEDYGGSTTGAWTQPWVVGHRGALYQELENTLPGFQYCADIGVDAVELDVFRVNYGNDDVDIDEQLLVFHGGEAFPGDVTDYCLNHAGRSIMDLTRQEIEQLQFNPNHGEFACPPEKILSAKIPTLRQVLELYQPTNIVVKIELKGPGVVEPVLALVQELNMQHQCHYASFYHDRIHLIRTLHPETHPDGSHVYKTGALFADHVPDDFIDRAMDVGASEVHLKYDTCTVERIRRIHDAGMKSMAWFRGPVGMSEDCSIKYSKSHSNNDGDDHVGNEDEVMYHVVARTGVQQLCCNRPDVLINMLKKRNGMRRE